MSFPLVKRFQRHRWSDTRKRIDGLKPGQIEFFPMSEFNNAITTIQRLKEAYQDTRAWSYKRLERGLSVRAINMNARVEKKKTSHREHGG